jgi:two-component system, chemotaxis family, CheB/CheR fusion protein
MHDKSDAASEPLPQSINPRSDPVPNVEPDRQAQPVDAEQPPRLAFPVVGIGASAGGLEAISEFLEAMRPDSQMAFVLIQHLPPDHESLMSEILSKRTSMKVLQVEDGMAVHPNHLYVIRPGHTLTIKDGALHLGEPVAKRGHGRPVDDFFKSLAEEQRERAISIIMSGMGSNGTAGCQAIKAVGGMCIAQDPQSAEFPSMPRHLIDSGYADYILRPSEMPDVLLAYAGHPYARDKEAADKALKRDESHLREILALLRIRTHQDFAGYKKPTILRRVQRRMGLTQLTRMGDYSKVLRQNPNEVTALADDLLIHVTGFFRDPFAWEALRREVIVPLVAGKEADAALRCWVTACSSGEEAYSLAMLLVEEAERIAKPLDIKVFATDMADRSLQNARAGIYPGGIEAEVTPERLARFFQQEDEVYHVRQDLRERVTFAPQNVLQDPPFSRLDIVSCRNLLIYLEPQVQQRLLGLLHFGLRERGILFLGTSETISGNEELFEPIDKHARIYRRIGATRHGELDFPLPRMLREGVEARRRERSDPGIPRLSLAQLTQRTLLAHHTPAAVMVDSEHRILYFHGDTNPFLDQPRGAATRDLLSLAREGVRGAVRIALHRAAADHAPATVREGWVESEQGVRSRLLVTASPAGEKGTGDYFVVSFEKQGEFPTGAEVAKELGGSGNGKDLARELQRVRAELQSTIEELQTSNEEMKASNEEAMSMNEELQSTNEEIETSKEEMQSLNEELITVNSQLESKIIEHQSACNDLSSLLTSTDLAVLFLDRQLAIRRYTPAMKDLLEVISSDVGRPLTDLARKFNDPELVPDAQAVLAKLTPIEREITGQGGRCYLRRTTPYRTTDNHIEGVVITFVEITESKKSAEELRRSEERFRALVSATSQVLYRISPDLSEMIELQGGGFIPTTESPTRNWLRDYIHPDDQEMVKRVWGEALRAKAIFQLEHRVRRVDGTWGWAMSRAVPLLDAEGNITEWFGAARDIGSRKRAEEALLDAEERIRLLVENVRDYALFQVDPGGLITSWNTGAQRLFGYPAAEILGRSAQILFAPQIVPDSYLRQELDEVLALGRTERQEWMLRRDGTLFWATWISTPIHDQSGQLRGFAKILRDETEERRAQEALRESEERFRLMVDGAKDFAIFMLDPKGIITAWNDGAERLLGFSEAEAVGQSGTIVFTPEDRAAGRAEMEMAQAAATGRAMDERWHVRKSGARFWANGVLHAVRGPGAAVRGFVKVLRDETVRKETEIALQAAKNAADDANRMKDEFLAVMSHELRTPLSAILLWAGILNANHPDREELKEGLAAIITSAEAQKELIEDMLDTSRIASGTLRLKLRNVDLASLVRDSTEAILPTAVAKKVAIKIDLSPDTGDVRADTDRLRQVIWNLLTNAVKFTPSGGSIHVTTARRGDTAEVEVADTGEGISSEFLPYLFEPFKQADASTTRRQGGVGLGLAITRQLVELHGGTISAQSPGPGKGATFTVRIPSAPVVPGERREEEERPARRFPTASRESLAGAHVLLVEDDTDMRNAVMRVLGQAGVEVTAVGSAAAALEAYDRRRPHLVLSDIGLPETDGYSLLRQLRQREAAARIKPVPAVAVTAFARHEDRQKAIDSGFQQYLSKPVEPEELLATVGMLLKTRNE